MSLTSADTDIHYARLGRSQRASCLPRMDDHNWVGIYVAERGTKQGIIILDNGSDIALGFRRELPFHTPFLEPSS